MNCPNCEKEMELKDTTYSNINTPRCRKGEHTGDIYYCEECDITYLDNFISERLELWSY